MNQRARMWKTLACLVGAMTGTAALLGWIDPSPPLVADTPSHDEVARLARAIVADGVDVDRDRWAEIEVAAGTSPSPAGSLLAASARRRECHFYISLDGRPLRARQWQAQQVFRDAPSTVRIEVAQTGEGQPMSSLEWVAVRALIVALNEAISPGGASLPVRLQESWEQVYGAETGADFEAAS